ncbi:MAG: hypothetical protein K2J01_07155 [Clostridiales bacterium]|nr:hypothetical protein [Clostridiales bacterium]
MSFKNAFKNLIAHFGVVWAVLLYLIVCSAIIVGLSLPFILPIARAFKDAGVFDGISNAFTVLMGDGGWNGFWDGLFDVYNKIIGVFNSNSRVVSLLRMFVIFVLLLAFRFFFGLYEIPLATVMDGRMSCNAGYSFIGKFISTLGVSVRFSLAKMPIMIAIDAITFAIIYGLASLIGLSVALPFVIILVIIVMRAFRSSLTSSWAPCVAGGMGVIKGFARSCEICFKRFGSIYSTYVIMWLLVVACGLFVIIFTLGVGIIIAFPFAMCILGYIGITVYYNKTGKRYYIDGTVFTPPMENVL